MTDDASCPIPKSHAYNNTILHCSLSMRPNFIATRWIISVRSLLKYDGWVPWIGSVRVRARRARRYKHVASNRRIISVMLQQTFYRNNACFASTIFLYPTSETSIAIAVTESASNCYYYFTVLAVEPFVETRMPAFRFQNNAHRPPWGAALRSVSHVIALYIYSRFIRR